MILGPTSEKRLALVHPRLATLIRLLADELSEPIGVTQGKRDRAEQKALYMQGRFTLEEVNRIRLQVGWAPLSVEANEETVTKAQPGYSWHEFGLAVDVVPFESSGEPDWDEAHPIWNEIIEKGQELGLTSGTSWKDEPHFQLTGRFPETPTDEVRQLALMGGIQAVWNASGIQNEG